jgi:hypothetical protein
MPFLIPPVHVFLRLFLLLPLLLLVIILIIFLQRRYSQHFRFTDRKNSSGFSEDISVIVLYSTALYSTNNNFHTWLFIARLNVLIYNTANWKSTTHSSVLQRFPICHISLSVISIFLKVSASGSLYVNWCWDGMSMAEFVAWSALSPIYLVKTNATQRHFRMLFYDGADTGEGNW